jgi:hypothetical protein
LNVNATKSCFTQEELEYLGYWITRNRIQPATEFKPTTKNTKESITSDLRRKADDHKQQVRKSKCTQKGVEKKSTTKKPKEKAEIDEDGLILVTGNHAARSHNNKYNHNRQQEVNQLHNMMSYQAMKMMRRKRIEVMKMTKKEKVKAMKMTKMKKVRAKRR